MLNRTDSLTHRDCGNHDVVTIAEPCLNRIESYTARLSGYKYSTVAVDCNSGVWAFLLRAFCPNISCPISGIQPFFVSLQSDLEHIANHVNYINCRYCSTPKKAVKNGEKGPPQGTYLVQTVSCLLEPLTAPQKKPYMVASESPSHESSCPLSIAKAEESVSESCLHFAL